MVFDNILLDRETEDIYSHEYPDHHTFLSMIIHTEEDDHYPEQIMTGDFTLDYDGNLGDDITTSIMLGFGDFRKFIYPHRDKLMITLIINYNGKEVKKLYKGILLTNPDMTSSDNNSYSDGTMNKMSAIEVIFQCIDPLYTAMKNITVNGVVNNNDMETVIRHYLSKAMEKVVIDGEAVEPILDITPIQNTRIYQNIILDDRVKLLDLPGYLQARYGLYNGGVGVYITSIDEKQVISVYPAYNSNIAEGKYHMTIYIPDRPLAADTNNKTVIVDDKEVRIIGSSASKMEDTGEITDFDYGLGFKSTNSGKVLDRTFEKSGGVVYANAKNMVDEQIVEGSESLLATPVFNVSTDNLYGVRCIIKHFNKLV